MALPEKKEQKAIVANTILFSELTESSLPVKPAPEDSMIDIQYQKFFEKKCSICNSPFRERAEHIYLESNKKVMAVINFFQEYYNAKLNYAQVATHMEHHCSFRNVTVSGLRSYELREEEIAHWKFREFDLVLTALLVELDDIRAIDCAKNNELKLKRATLVERLTNRILDVKMKRDEATSSSFDIFNILYELYESMESPADKDKIKQKVREIRLKLTQERNEG